jgi:hypothetical protein
VNAVADVPDVRYAVIKGLQTETGHERIVIAYSNEESLRDLIAAPSIVAFGFASRDEAVVAGRASLAAPETNRPKQRLNWAASRAETGWVLRLGRFLVTSSSNLVTSAIVTFFSSNTVSAAIRMTLGSSV